MKTKIQGRLKYPTLVNQHILDGIESIYKDILGRLKTTAATDTKTNRHTKNGYLPIRRDF